MTRSRVDSRECVGSSPARSYLCVRLSAAPRPTCFTVCGPKLKLQQQQQQPGGNRRSFSSPVLSLSSLSTLLLLWDQTSSNKPVFTSSSSSSASVCSSRPGLRSWNTRYLTHIPRIPTHHLAAGRAAARRYVMVNHPLPTPAVSSIYTCLYKICVYVVLCFR